MNKQSIALMVLWALSTIVLSVVLLQQRNELKRLENNRGATIEAKYQQLETKYDSLYVELKASQKAINDTLELSRLRQSTQINTLNYRLTQSTRKYEALNTKLNTANNDSLLLLLAEYLSEVDTLRAR